MLLYRLLCLILFLLPLAILIADKINDASKPYENIRYGFFALLFIFCLLYTYLMPIVFYNDGNLFIKQYKSKEEAIPFKDIYSLKVKRFSTFQGISTFIIEYRDSQNYREKIKFRASIFSKRTKGFIEKLKKANPNIS